MRCGRRSSGDGGGVHLIMREGAAGVAKVHIQAAGVWIHARRSEWGSCTMVGGE